jgi:hypothetical protein
VNKNILLIGITILVLGLFLGCTQNGTENTSGTGEKTTMIFRFKEDYTGNYLGITKPDTNTETGKLKSYATIELFTVCGDYNKNNWVCKTDSKTKAQTCSCVAPGLTNATQDACPITTYYGCVRPGDLNSRIRTLNYENGKVAFLAISIPNTTAYVDSLTIFKRTIATTAGHDLNALGPNMGNSPYLQPDRFAKFVKENDPFSEAYFCSIPFTNADINTLKNAANNLLRGTTPKNCTKVI